MAMTVAVIHSAGTYVGSAKVAVSGSRGCAYIFSVVVFDPIRVVVLLAQRGAGGGAEQTRAGGRVDDAYVSRCLQCSIVLTGFVAMSPISRPSRFLFFSQIQVLRFFSPLFSCSGVLGMLNTLWLRLHRYCCATQQFDEYFPAFLCVEACRTIVIFLRHICRPYPLPFLSLNAHGQAEMARRAHPSGKMRTIVGTRGFSLDLSSPATAIRR